VGHLSEEECRHYWESVLFNPKLLKRLHLREPKQLPDHADVLIGGVEAKGSYTLYHNRRRSRESQSGLPSQLTTKPGFL